jgi:hypothetical protein
LETHRQLPAYGGDKMGRLLEDPQRVRAAVVASEAFIAKQLKDLGMEEIFDDVESEDTNYGRLCSNALETLTLFETLVEAELPWHAGHPKHRPIARRLTEQHRMHPANRGGSPPLFGRWASQSAESGGRKPAQKRTHAAQKTSRRAFPVLTFVYLSVECPSNKFYGINCRPKLSAKLLDRFFHSRR